jgi:hypothetical protein
MTSQFNSSVSSQTLIVIDSTVSDRQTLINGVSSATVVVLDAARNGVEQITEALMGADNVTSLHIVSHGAPGALFLGNTQLSLGTLDEYASHVAAWSLALADEASILLYGCNVAAGDAGAEFIEALHGLTHAHIGASQTLTGNAALGGNWDLEVTTGDIAPLAFGAEAMAAFDGVLETVALGDASWTILDVGSPETGDIDESVDGGLRGLDSQRLVINGSAFDAASITQTQPDSLVATRTIGDLEVTIEYRAIAGIGGEPVLRQFVTFRNLGTTELTGLDFEVVSDTAGGNPVNKGTSNGATDTFDPADRFVIVEPDTDEGNAANNGFITFANFGGNPSVAELQSQGLVTAYNDFVLAGGASKSFVLFNGVSETLTEANTEAAQYASADTLAANGLLVGLTTAQRSALGLSTTSGNLIVTPVAGTTTTEAGGTAAFNVALSKQPEAGNTVTVNLASSDATEGTVDKATGMCPKASPSRASTTPSSMAA